MVTGFDLLPNNQPLQKHWVKRVIAYIVDLIISSVAFWILFAIFSLGFGRGVYIFFPFTVGLVQVFYSAILEYWNRQTVGKILMDLEVEGLRGGVDLPETLIRNISKVHGLLLFLDWIVAMATDGDPRQRYLDRIASTTVIGASEPRHIEDFLKSHMHMPGRGKQDQEEQVKGKERRKCMECGGELEDVGEGLSECKNCGRIQ